MALSPSMLATSLEHDWLVAEGGDYPSSPVQSGDAFAGAVAGWFALATAGPFPCSTASARRSQLAAGATGALQAGDPNIAAAQLALALASYMVGQAFGPGMASPPIAVSAAQSAIAGAFGDLEAAHPGRANQIATGIHTLATSTIVVFPPVISPPAPVT
jgi:hypothetical protein